MPAAAELVVPTLQAAPTLPPASQAAAAASAAPMLEAVAQAAAALAAAAKTVAGAQAASPPISFTYAPPPNPLPACAGSPPPLRRLRGAAAQKSAAQISAAQRRWRAGRWRSCGCAAQRGFEGVRDSGAGHRDSAGSARACRAAGQAQPSSCGRSAPASVSAQAAAPTAPRAPVSPQVREASKRRLLPLRRRRCRHSRAAKGGKKNVPNALTEGSNVREVMASLDETTGETRQMRIPPGLRAPPRRLQRRLLPVVQGGAAGRASSPAQSARGPARAEKPRSRAGVARPVR